MASVRLGSVVADIRGSVGEETYGRNLGGIFVRARTTPSQPASAERDLRQAAIAAIMAAWSGTLTQTQRDGWMQYGRTHLLPNKWGTLGKRPGHLHYLRCNVQIYRVIASALFSNAPARAPIYPPTFTLTADASLNTIAIDVPPTNYLTPRTTLRLYAYAGHVLNIGRVFYNGPWRYMDWNTYVAGSWVKDPWSMAYPWTLTAGKRVYARLVAQYNTGEISHAHQAPTIIVP